ncbi:SDR family NAD(P)-dependent oxidoreductase [Amycolatopsis rhabdoformis]|uniref:SDR family NAD(P)-dependent oxidoreductase n=1 Tax=Amycolatopsis rhabdoformis TaxID=1448059 RepID=A0ABZ1IGJ7_9PSEU|nr:SDR family NAD(P)-dependent oxidoreductase [Amycolatopsis rhabdoformis]WSE33539.1 SDR family NAD(P)-dependent oxidoreductase [Amycolatopsis rhabdoformis]
MGWLDGEVAIVTGGGSGIGRAVVNRYVAEGAKVVVTDLDETLLKELEAEHGEAVTGLVADARLIEDNQRVVRHAVEVFGKLDIFVANAGMGDRFTEIVDIPDDKVADAYQQVFDVNVKGVILGAKAAVKELVRSSGAFIVTLSNSSFYPDGGGVMYISSKHAALGIVRQLGHEWAPWVRVNAVAPGGTKTNIRIPEAFGLDENGKPIRAHSHPSNADSEVERVTPLRTHSDPEDHAAAFVLVASRTQGKAMTGTVIESDGGLGVRGLRRVRGGDDLHRRFFGDEG